MAMVRVSTLRKLSTRPPPASARFSSAAPFPSHLALQVCEQLSSVQHLPIPVPEEGLLLLPNMPHAAGPATGASALPSDPQIKLMTGPKPEATV